MQHRHTTRRTEGVPRWVAGDAKNSVCCACTPSYTPIEGVCLAGSQEMQRIVFVVLVHRRTPLSTWPGSVDRRFERIHSDRSSTRWYMRTGWTMDTIYTSLPSSIRKRVCFPVHAMQFFERTSRTQTDPTREAWISCCSTLLPSVVGWSALGGVEYYCETSFARPLET